MSCFLISYCKQEVFSVVQNHLLSDNARYVDLTVCLLVLVDHQGLTPNVQNVDRWSVIACFGYGIKKIVRK